MCVCSGLLNINIPLYPRVVTANAQWNPAKSPLLFQETVVQMGLGARVSPNPAEENVGGTIILCLPSKGKIWASRIRFWPGQMMPGLFLKEIATKAGIQHPAQKLHFETVFERNPTQKGLASKPWCKINLKLLTFLSSLREIRGNWHILLSRLGVWDPARKVNAWMWLHQ